MNITFMAAPDRSVGQTFRSVVIKTEDISHLEYRESQPTSMSKVTKPDCIFIVVAKNRDKFHVSEAVYGQIKSRMGSLEVLT